MEGEINRLTCKQNNTDLWNHWQHAGLKSLQYIQLIIVATLFTLSPHLVSSLLSSPPDASETMFERRFA